MGARPPASRGGVTLAIEARCGHVNLIADEWRALARFYIGHVSFVVPHQAWS